jgi:hypothetical protein
LWAARGAYQHCTIDPRGHFQAILVEQSIKAGQVLDGRCAGHVIKREHRVRLAAAEVCLQFDHRVTPGASKPLGGANKKRAQAFSKIRSAEKLLRVPIFGRRPSRMYFGKIRRKLRLLKLARSNVWMRLDHLTPGKQSRHSLDRNFETLRFPSLLVSLKFGKLRA